jgi:hypothetical protein
MGGFLLFCALLLIIFGPPKQHFNILHLYSFMACFVAGFLLIAGFVGTHPAAARIRREAIRAGSFRTGPLCPIIEQKFPYQARTKARAAAALSILLGVLLIGLGVFLFATFSSDIADRFLAGTLPAAAGILFLWIGFRYPSRFVEVTPEILRIEGYFKTVSMPWQDILALVAREHFVWTVGGFTSTGILYSVYSGHSKLWFSSQTPGSEQLAESIAAATGLPWNSL